jgi:hypothetical protein
VPRDAIRGRSTVRKREIAASRVILLRRSSRNIGG